MFKSILVPLDGTPFAEHALPLAASIARQSGATLRLLQVLPPLADRYFWAPLPGSQLEHDLHKHYHTQARNYLQSVGQRVNSGIPITCEMLDEHIDIAEAIETGVSKFGVDLVVMPSHGRGALKRFWLGSIADDVYRSSSVPVLLARPGEEKAVIERESLGRHIVVTLDGSEQAEDVLEPALIVGQAMEAELLLVRVIAPPPAPHATGNPLNDVASSALDDRERRNASNYLHTLAERLRARGARVRTQLLASADPASAIVEIAAGTDLIAMQTQARRGVSRLIHGSVVDKVVQNSAVPILISRPHKK